MAIMIDPLRNTDETPKIHKYVIPMTVKDYIIENRRKRVEAEQKAEQEAIERKKTLFRIRSEACSKLYATMAECVGMKVDMSIFPGCKSHHANSDIKGIVKLSNFTGKMTKTPYDPMLIELLGGDYILVKLHVYLTEYDSVNVSLETLNAKKRHYNLTDSCHEFTYEAAKDKPFECEDLCDHARAYLVEFFDKCVVNLESVESKIKVKTDGFDFLDIGEK